MLLISSRDNHFIKNYIKLRDSKSRRHNARLFVIEGARLAQDALDSGAHIETAFLSEEAREKYAGICLDLETGSDTVCDVTSEVARALSDTQNGQGIFCTVRIPSKASDTEALAADGAYLALEDIQDPGNLGAMLRTAEAMGFNVVIMSRGCVDAFAPKVARASMGAVFRLPLYISEDLPHELELLSQKGVKTYAAVARQEEGVVDINKADLANGVCAVIGNEGAGLSSECMNACSARLTVYMPGRAESLNAAAAATIIMWEISKKRTAFSDIPTV